MGTEALAYRHLSRHDASCHPSFKLTEKVGRGIIEWREVEE